MINNCYFHLRQNL